MGTYNGKEGVIGYFTAEREQLEAAIAAAGLGNARAAVKDTAMKRFGVDKLEMLTPGQAVSIAAMLPEIAGKHALRVAAEKRRKHEKQFIDMAQALLAVVTDDELSATVVELKQEIFDLGIVIGGNNSVEARQARQAARAMKEAAEYADTAEQRPAEIEAADAILRAYQ